MPLSVSPICWWKTEELSERQEYIKIVRENNNLLLQLISDILDLSKIEAGTFEFTSGDVDVNLLCEDIVRSMGMKAKGEVELVLDNHLPVCHVISDRNRIHQVISNFVNNAMKFTSEGSIHVGCRRQKMANWNSMLKIQASVLKKSSCHISLSVS